MTKAPTTDSLPERDRPVQSGVCLNCHSAIRCTEPKAILLTKLTPMYVGFAESYSP